MDSSSGLSTISVQEEREDASEESDRSGDEAGKKIRVFGEELRIGKEGVLLSLSEFSVHSKSETSSW